MAKQLNVNLAFTADTSQAKAQLQALQTQLQSLTSTSFKADSGLGFSKEIQNAITLTSKLKSILIEATNVNTGKLDLSKFNEGLQKSNTSLQSYSTALNSLGAQGQQAFSQLANSILQSEMPLKRANGLLSSFMVTLKNTVKWQISSSLLHGFIGTVKGAYGYAQDLNESLNNIRIVTGANVIEMAKFAEQANNAAKALSTTTNEYAKASLIYYQQGLSDQAVQDRTNVTIKMANVSRQSAEIVSDQMTAVWNNFAKGGENLERFADVMVRLGADTASSSDEIATGLEKFAAIGDMVGLSFNNAAAALATVTATTRQSADTVGTAFKTIFARIQGLKLGETLEDGTDLNKYSEALATVGISIKEQNGELKDMDTILAEMGAKWQTLSKDQQTALAQTVAGVRQYNQLVALMENFDFYEENLDRAANAEGSLQEQADIYAESWEAASKRVRASAEGIYSSLLNDKFFISLNNGLANLLELIDRVIESFGGLPGVIFLLGSTITSVFHSQIANSFDNLIYRIKMTTEVGRKSVNDLRQQASSLLITNSIDTATTSGATAADAYRAQGEAQNALIANAERLSEIEKQQAQFMLDGHRTMVQQVITLGEAVEQEERRTVQIERSVMAQARAAAMRTNPVDHGATQMENVQVKIDQLKNLEQAYYQLSTVPLPSDPTKNIDENALKMAKTVINELEQEYGELTAALNNKKLNSSFGKDVARIFVELKQAVESGKISADQFNLIMDKLATAGNTKIRKLTQAFIECGMSEAEAQKLAARLASQYDTLGDKTAQLTEETIRLGNSTKNFQNFVNGAKGSVQTLGSAITTGINAFSSFGMMIMSIKGMVDTLNNTEMSFGEKFITITTQMGFMLPSVLSTITQLSTLLGPSGYVGSLMLANSTLDAYIGKLSAEQAATFTAIIANKGLNAEMSEEARERAILGIMQAGDISRDSAEAVLEALLTKQKLAKNAATMKEIALEIAKNAVRALTNPYLLATVVIMGTLTAATWAFIYASQEEERALQAAQDSVENTKRAYEDAEKAVTSFKETASDYSEAIKSMKDLAYGTAEYAEKLREANDAAIELIKNNPDLKYDIQGGLIQFEGGMDALEAMEKQLMNQTYNAKLFNVNSELKYNDLNANNTIRNGLEANTDISIGMENSYLDQISTQFIKELSQMQYEEQVGTLQNKEVIRALVQEATRNAGAIVSDSSKNLMADEIYEEVQNGNTDALLNLAKEVGQNTVALQAETAALLQEEYGQKNVSKYGEAEVYAAKSSILDERMSKAWTDEHGRDTGFAQYLDDDLDLKNNISELSKENQELLAKIMGKSVEDIVNGEIRISDSKVEVSTEKDASNSMLPAMSIEDFNRAALNLSGQGEVTWEDISAKLDTIEGREQMQQYAKDSGLYSADDLRILDKASGFNELTYGMAKALETKFSDEAQVNNILQNQPNYNYALENNLQGQADFERQKAISLQSQTTSWNESVQEYLKGVDTSIKENVANRLLELDTSTLNFGDIDSTLKEIEEQEATKYREQEAKTELQSDSKKHDLDYAMTEKQMGRVKETLQDYNKELEKNGKLGEKVEKEGNQLTKGYGNLEKSSKDLTVANQRMNRGIATLGDNFEDWSKVLKTGDKTTLEYTEAIEGMKEAFADIYNIADSSLISDDFLENMDPAIMKQIADGNIEAIESMRMAMADDIVANIIVNNELTTAEGDTVTSLWQQAKAELDAMGDLTVGTHIEGTSEFVTRLNELIKASGMTKDQVNSLLGSMGMSATLHTKYEPTEMQVPTYTEVVEPGSPVKIATGKDADGNPTYAEVQGYKRYTVPGEPITVQGFAEVVSIETESGGTSSGGGIDVIGSGKPSPSNTGRASGSGGGGGKGGKGGKGGGGGGGSDKPKKPTQAKTVEKTDPKEKDDEIERYKEITEVIDDLNNELDEIGKLKDEAWGPNKLKAMDQEIAKLKQLSKAQQQYSDEIQNKLIGDRAAVKALGGDFDEFGRLKNYEEVMGSLVDAWNSTQASLDAREQAYENSVAAVANTEYAEGQESQQWAAEDANEAEKEAIGRAREDADKIYEDGKKAIEQYIETLNLSEEAKRQLEDYQRQIKELNYEKLMYKVEFKVEVNDRELKILEHKAKLMENNFYKTSEMMAKLQEKTAFYADGEKGILDDIEKGVANLKEEFEAGNITQADYIEGLGTFQDMAMENVEALYEMNEAMREYYADVIDDGISKIKDLSSHFEHLTSKLQHYQSILSLMGHEQNYDLQNNLLSAQIENLKNQIAVSKETMGALEGQLANAKSSYEKANTEEDKEYWRERIVQINNALTEEEDTYLSYVESVGEAANQILTNKIEKAFKEAELASTNNLGFDAILADMDRLNTLTDEYLTNTNKMYETNKIIASAQTSIDKTQNTQAKKKYQDYIKYIEQLQVSGNLSKSELEVAQARYKILEAEIALEEAKNAKSEVRLTRDSEGNFGYVYTANQDTVADATQNYLDAQNELYNIGLENTQNYREKTLQLQQQTLEDLKQLELDFRVNHIISEEQYNQQKAALLETSNALLTSYQEQFNLAQFTMASTQYSTLMEADDLFYDSQLSKNKNNRDLMEIRDSEYYGGLKSTATNTQETLQENLDSFNLGILDATDTQYEEMGEKDSRYYTTLQDLCSDNRDIIDGIFNTDKDSLSEKIGGDFYDNLDDALSDCYDATEDWQIDTKDLVEAVGVAFDGSETGEEGLTQKIQSTKEESQALKDFLIGKDGEKGFIKTIEEEWNEVHTATDKWTAHWEELDKVIERYEDLIELSQELTRQQANEVLETPNDPTPPPDYSNVGDTGGGGSSSGGGSSGNEGLSGVESAAAEIVRKVHFGEAPFKNVGGSGWYAYAENNNLYTKEARDLARKAFNDSKSGGGYSYIYDIALGLAQSYDTGGYTGEWGPEGKMAVLHEKELVLNAQDTENFLTATTMLSQISQMLDNNALLASLGMINLSAMTLNTEADKVLQQEVTIHADFPNVTDHNEIEMAIDNLINAASQYANRK